MRALPAALATLLLATLCGCPGPADPPEAEGGAGGSSGGSGGGGGEPSGAWEVEVEDLERVVLSVWGSGPEDLWVVGGGLGNGPGALALHHDGVEWEERDPGVTTTLWWVWGSGPGDVWAVGEAGTIVHWDGSAFTSIPPITTATLFGVWGSGPSDVWAVGGTPAGAGPDDVLLHYDGGSWSVVELPEPRGVSFYKIWGSGPGDFWICGQGGLALHVSGGSYSWYAAPIATTIFTISGAGEELWMVGGAPVLLVHLDREADALVQEEPAGFASMLNGVSVEPSGDLWVVGTGGVKWRREAGEWIDETRAEPHANLHAVFALGDGSALSVGGDFLSPPTPGGSRRGVVARFRPAP